MGTALGAHTPPLPIRSFLAVAGESGPSSSELAELGLTPVGPTGGRLRLALAPRGPDEPAATGAAWLLGDPAELRDPELDASSCCANAARLGLDAAAGRLELLTSLVGLPPVFLLERPGLVAATSDIRHLVRFGLRLDPQGLRELARIGQPIGGRTLFRDLRLAPAGSRLVLTAAGTASLESVWSAEASAPPARNHEEFLELQIAAFERSLAHHELSRSFLSLTAGLDTRAVLAVLARDGRSLPAVTLSGETPSLDARIALRLCRAYGIEHRCVRFAEAFERSLPELVLRSCELSGGLASLEQAPEVHLYHELGGAFQARVSGNLGNQIGRGGTEGLSLRGVDPRLLAAELRDDARAREEAHWLEAAIRSGLSREAVLLTQEIPYTSAANYGIGNHYALQQTPYGSRELVEALLRRPHSPQAQAPQPSILRMRLRDLRHRFLGEPESHSFQRRLIRRIGGSAAQIPINWGWRASGGVSLGGVGLGAASLLGMAASARGWDEGRARSLWRASRLVAIHDFRRMRAWLRGPLGELVRDTLGGRAVRESGLFDAATLERWLEEHYAGRADHHGGLLYALDLALAAQVFRASL